MINFTEKKNGAKILESLTQKMAEERTCEQLVAEPTCAAAVLEDFRVRNDVCLKKVVEAIHKHFWLFEEGKKVSYPGETAVILMLIQKNEGEVFAFRQDFLNALKVEHPKMAQYLQTGYVQDLKLNQLGELLAG